MKPSDIDANKSVARRLSGSPLKYLQRYALAILSVGVALGSSLLFEHFHFRVPSALLLLFAVAISSWFAGPRPGMLAFILSIISFYWYFVEPVRTVYIYPSQIPYFIVFVAFALLILWFATVRRRAEADLRQSHSALQEQASLLNLAHDAVYVRDMKGVIRYWNRGAEQLYGWPSDQALGKISHEFLKAVFPAPLEEVEDELLRTGRWEGELAKTRKDGTQLAVASRWSLKRDDRGEPVAILVTSNDITERKRAEEASRRLNRELLALSKCNQILLRATDEQRLLEKICRIVCEEAGYRMACVNYAEHDEAKSVRLVAWTGDEAEYFASAGITWADTDRGRGPTGTAIRSGETCCVQDFATDPRTIPWREELLQRGFRSGIGLPLRDEHANAFGSLTIFSAQTNAFTSEEVRLLEELAADLAFGIVTIRSRAARTRAEDALRRSETYLSEAQRLSHTGSYAGDSTTRSLYWSEELYRIFGVDPQNGVPGFAERLERIHPEDRNRFLGAYQRAIREKVDTEVEYRISLPDGTVKHVRGTGHPVLSASGDLVEVVGTVVDITERKRAEEGLRRSEAYLAESQRLTHTGSWALDGTTWKPVYWSEETFRIWGFDPQHGLPTWDQVIQRIHPEDLQMYKETSETALAEQADVDFEYRIVLPDGTVKHLHSLAHPVMNSAGMVLEIVGTTVDITERKRSEEALRESETRFRTFVDHAADALFVYDLEQRTIIDVNRSACEGLGYTRQQLIGNTPDFFHLDSDRAHLDSVLQRAKAGESVFDKHWHQRKDGSIFPVETHTSLVSYGGRSFLLKVCRDITDRLRAEEQREKLRQLEADLAHMDRLSMLGEMAASVTHELKQPIAAAALNAGVCLRWLKRDDPNLHEAGEAATRIIGNANYAADVIDRLRSLYKKSPPKRELVDLNETIRQMVALMLGEANRHAVSILVDVADGLPPINADGVQLQQVLMNLMLNGIEAMHDTGGVLTVKSRPAQDGEVEISVSDTGVGLPAGKADQVFNAFFTTKAQGSGMGLSISRSIVESHGGRIWATSNDGPGATFHFALPIAVEAEELAAVS